eukprot:11201173-Lingulodinium_polyedra.AAC.1
MEADGDRWKQLETEGSRWRRMETDGDRRRGGHGWKPMQTNGDTCNTHEDRWWRAPSATCNLQG